MGYFFWFFWLPLALYLAYLVFRKFNPYPTLPSAGKLVLITGCDTGFGNMTTRKLDKMGYKVLSACLTDKGIQELRDECSKNVIPFKMDVTKKEDIEAAAELVKKHGGKLWGLVNNAGISRGAYVEWNSPQVYEQVMAVNYFAHVNVTRALLSSLVAGGGRIVNITSCAAYIASASMSAYASSKYALEGFSDSLRREMAPWGVKVSIIQPSFCKTPIVETSVSNWAPVWDPLSDEVKKKYGQEWYEWHSTNLPIKLNQISESPEYVVNDIAHAISNLHPYLRYHPGIGGKVIWVLAMLPAPWVDFIIHLGNKTPLPAALKK
eukprot:TRINITY_DN2701_c0_g1_i1.p1 TRINITY_DN2701_c0_g1~~TRINITY_DN2701_c0_g1_i1.p1  ORF type:complete len:352 (+),score=90.88 TRINITY_DN2701_c0_g1_i1:95-1057(+)